MIKLCIILFLISSSYAYSKWQEIEMPKGKVRIDDVLKVDNNLIAYSTKTFYNSTDNGVSWLKINSKGLDSLIEFNDVYVKDNNIYVLSYANAFQQVGLYKSSDYCQTFNRVLDFQIKDFIIKNNDWYFISTILYKSTNLGKNFDTLFDFKSKRYTNLDLVNDIIIMYDKGARYGVPPIKNNGILYSLDDGKTWLDWNNGIVKDKYLFSDVYFSNNVSIIAAENELFFSSEIGEKWEKINLPYININLTSVELYENIIFIGTKIGEVFKSNDYGKTWDLLYKNSNFNEIKNISNIYDEIYFTNFGIQKINNNIIIDLNLYDNVMSKSLFYENDKYYLFALNQGFYFKNDNNSSWEILNDSINKFGIYGSGIKMKDSLIISHDIVGNSIVVSNDLGNTWRDTLLGQLSDFIYDSFIFDSLIMVTSRFNLYYSNDKGNSFISFRDNNPDFNYRMRDIYFDGQNYFATGFNTGILISTDNGISWKESHTSSDSPIRNQTTFKLTINKNILVTTKHNPINSYSNSVFISSDLGKTWSNSIFSENEVYIYDMINYKDNIFMINTDGFMYSKDNGENWLKYNTGIENLKLSPITSSFIKELKIINGNIYLVAKNQIFSITLSEFGIEYTSVDKIEERNFLFIDPPYPNPVDENVIIKFQWDISIPFINDNIEIFDINGSRINTKDKVRFERISNYSGKFIWDTSSEKKGVYFIKINHGTEMKVCKILLE